MILLLFLINFFGSFFIKGIEYLSIIGSKKKNLDKL